MAIREYIGARYVPIFGRKGEDSIEWDNSKPYEPLTIVLYQGNSFTSRQYVPAGIDINNEQYWASTGVYNAQVEQYRQEVRQFDGRITANAEGIEALNDNLEELEQETNARIDAETAAREAFEGTVNANFEAFEGTVNAKLEYFSLETMTIENMAGLWRIPVDIGNVRYGMEGCTAFKNGKNIISVAFLNNADTNGYLVSFVNGVEASRVFIDVLHHGNSMAYAEGYIYIPNNNTRKIWRIQINPVSGQFTGNPEIVCNSAGGNIVYDSREQKFYQITESTIVELDINTGSVISTIPAHFTGNVNNKATGQSANVFYIGNEKYFGYVYSVPNMLSICDAAGTFVANKEIPYYANYVCLGEPEAVTIFDDGDYIVFSNEPPVDQAITKTCFAFKGNAFINNGKLSTKESATTSTYIFCYPSNLEAYNFPTTNEGPINSTNPICISRLQDCQYIINALQAKNASVHIIEDGAAKNALILAGINAYVAFNQHVLSGCEFRHSTVEAIQTEQHMNETSYDNQRIRIIECPLFVTRYNSSNPKALYANNSVVGITTTMNEIIVKSGNCFVINPDA